MVIVEERRIRLDSYVMERRSRVLLQVDEIWDLTDKKTKGEFREGWIWLNDAEREGSKMMSGS